MQDTNAPVSRSTPASLQEDVVAVAYPAKSSATPPRAYSNYAYPQSLLRSILMLIKRWFSLAPRPAARQKIVRKAMPQEAPVAAAQQPIAFKGGTAVTIATPMGAYAGKPAQQRMRKLAEQQFHQMDVSQTTMN